MLVSIKHAGQLYKDVELDPSKPGLAFKQAVYEKTGVPIDRMKIMVKGGMLKDDSDWTRIAPKEGQVFMVIGAAGELPKPPEKPVVFLEDLDDKALASALQVPVGLENLGNTCYMNSTVQMLRSIPELRQELSTFSVPTASSGSAAIDVNISLTAALANVYDGMTKTTEAFPPHAFLALLRQANPQFGEVQRAGPGGMGGGGYAQQDADECWGQIMTSLANGGLGKDKGGWTDKYMCGEMETTLTCDEAPEEPSTTRKEKINKLQCNISVTTNYLHTGIMDSLDEKITKNSSTLGREAVYSQKSRLSRLPSNLTVQMVRFYWRREIGKKAKIMRKVKFPFELDVVAEGMVTEDLKKKLLPVNEKLKAIEKERSERRKIRRKTKKVTAKDQDVVMGDASTPAATDAETTAVVESKPGDELEPEKVYRQKEAEELRALVHPDVANDIGANCTGMYELCAIVTHKGASADQGHYIGWVKRDAMDPVDVESTDALDEWYKFDDDKVSVVEHDKIVALDGGGQDSTAYILLYRSKRLD